MYFEPTVNDFIAWVRWHLDKTAEQAIRSVEQSRRDAARTGQVGNAIAVIFENVRREFDAGISAALGELKRATRTTKLDRADLRQLTVQCLEQFAIAMKSVAQPENWATHGPGVSRFVAEQLANMDETLRFKLRQFDVGFFNPNEPEVPQVSNAIHIGSMTGSAIQQGSPSGSQTLSISIDVQNIKNLVDGFEIALRDANLSSDVHNELTADVHTIRTQLAKAKPSQAILREAGACIRRALEGAVIGAASAGLTAAAQRLFAAIGPG